MRGKSRCEFLDNWLSESVMFSLQLPNLRERIHEVGQGQGCRMGAVEDRLLDVRGQKGKAQDTGRIVWAGESLVGCDLLDALVFAHGQPSVPAVGPDQGVDQRNVSLGITVRVDRLAAGDGAQDGWESIVIETPLVSNNCRQNWHYSICTIT